MVQQEQATSTGSPSATPWKPVFWLVVLAALVVSGVAVVGPGTGIFPGSEMASDPLHYRDQMAEVFGGAIPYLEAEFEHLPVSFLPMALAWLGGGASGEFAYWVVFCALMVLALHGITDQVGRIGVIVGDGDAARRWLVLAAPLFPLAIARNDPLVILFAVVAFRLWLEGRERAGAAMLVAGTLAKGWPIVLLGDALWRGRRRTVAVAGAVSVATLGLVVLTDGFRSGRSFTGVHTESVAGGALGLVRVVRSEALGMLSTAGARYLEAPGWARAAGVVAGVALVGAALGVLRSSYRVDRSVAMTGAFVVALLVMSPLLSPQFVLWVLPFAALTSDRRTWRLGLAASALSFVLIAYWRAMSEGALWWWLLLNVRNLLLFALAVQLVRLARGGSVLRGAIGG